MPSNAELDRYYASNYRAEYQLAFLRPRKKHQIKKQREALRRLSRIDEIIGLDQSPRFLDFGCGSGELVRKIASRGCQSHGFEQGADYGGFGRDELAKEADGESLIRVGSWRQMDFSPKSFDLISCLHVLEHLNEPIAALERMHSWLADDGVLFLETPNVQIYPLKGFDGFHFAHVLGFSRDNLLYALHRTGFCLLHEDGPTSFFLVKEGDPRGRSLSYDIAATAKKNHADYTNAITLASYVHRQFHRVGKVLNTEVSTRRS